ncbi:MAG: hypothetical protein H0T46_29570 [Deltaproteobacteria bacterium]|nr:hypothetical protein [Deltaproteobacteria bacterium]
MRSLLLLLVAGIAHASPPAILPPVEIGVGKAAIATAHDSYTATEITVGLSWASLVPYSTAVDIGLGWLGSYSADNMHDASGVYASFAMRCAERSHVRAWFGVRGELLYTEERGVLGLAARGSLELWRGVEWFDQGGGVGGSLGLTVFVDAIVREGQTRAVVAGIGGRLPMFAAK